MEPLCVAHPRYRALRKPRAACEECWRAWIKKQDDEMKALAERLVQEHPLLCKETIPGHHLEECVRKYGHYGECSSSAMDYNK